MKRVKQDPKTMKRLDHLPEYHAVQAKHNQGTRSESLKRMKQYPCYLTLRWESVLQKNPILVANWLPLERHQSSHLTPTEKLETQRTSKERESSSLSMTCEPKIRSQWTQSWSERLSREEWMRLPFHSNQLLHHWSSSKTLWQTDQKQRTWEKLLPNFYLQPSVHRKKKGWQTRETPGFLWEERLALRFWASWLERKRCQRKKINCQEASYSGWSESEFLFEWNPSVSCLSSTWMLIDWDSSLSLWPKDWRWFEQRSCF